jgi:ArsR family transcriptional regulator, zinc-responsive transcriptional repressor
LDRKSRSTTSPATSVRRPRRCHSTTIFYSLENDHVAQLVTDAVFNAEHAGPGIPGHHRDSGDLAMLHARNNTDATPAPTAGERA